MSKWTTYWWVVIDEDSDLCGEEFFTELENATYEQHVDYAFGIFPDVELKCLGQVSEEEAEMMGLDTY